MRYLFDGLVLDLERYQLSGAAGPVEVQRKVFDVLATLLEHRGAIVSKPTLLAAHWPGEHVNRSAVAWAVSRARRALEAAGGDGARIVAVRGRGYRFAGDVVQVGSDERPSEVQRPSATEPASAPPVTKPTEPFVGRTRVVDGLVRRWTAATTGQGAFVVLHGEAGIGKTRCAREVTCRAERQTPGASVIWGRCVDEGAAPDFWPWTQIVRGLVAAGAGDDDLRALHSQLANRAGGGEVPRKSLDADRQRERFWLADEVATRLSAVAKARPLLLVIDDLQWADEASVAVLRTLATEVDGHALMLLATFRGSLALPGAAPKGTLRSRAPFAALLRLAQVLTLPALPHRAIADWATAVAGCDVPEDLVSSLAGCTGGNPLLLRHTLALWGGRGLLAPRRVPSPGALPVPEGVRGVLHARLAALPEPARLLLGCASVLGERFRLGPLAALSQQPVSVCADGLSAAVAGDIACRLENGHYGFQHGLMRDAAYEGLGASERMRLHAAAAQVLAAEGALDVEITYHLQRALPLSGADETLARARRAAQSAAAGSAFSEAARCEGWALAAMDHLPDTRPEERAAALLRRAQYLRQAGDARQARKAIAALVDFAQTHQLPDKLIEAASHLRVTVAMGGVPDRLALTALQGALAMLAPSQTRLRSQALALLSSTPPLDLDLSDSKAHSERAMQLGARTGDPRDTVEPLRARLYSLSGPDDTEALVSATDSLRRVAAAMEAPLALLDADLVRYGAALGVGDGAQAEQALGRLASMVQARQLREPVLLVRRLDITRLLQTGAFDAAAVQLGRWHAEASRLGLDYADFFAGVLGAHLSVLREGGQCLHDAPLEAMADRTEPSHPVARARLAAAAAEAGKLRLAGRLLTECFRDGRPQLPRDGSYLYGLCSLATAAVETGAPCRRRLFDLLRPYANRFAVDGFHQVHGSVSHYLGLLALSLGDRAGGHVHLRAAQAQALAQDYTPWALISGVALLESGGAGPSDGRGQTELSTWLRRTAEGIGMPRITQRL